MKVEIDPARISSKSAFPNFFTIIDIIIANDVEKAIPTGVNPKSTRNSKKLPLVDIVIGNRIANCTKVHIYTNFRLPSNS